MKHLIAFIMTAVQTTAWANPVSNYIFETVSCSVRAELTVQSSLELEAEFDLIQLSNDNSRLEIEQKVDGKIQKTAFKLNQVGKTSYMAIPEVITPDMSQFFVKIEEDRSEIEVSRLDSGAKYCTNGGLIIKTFFLETAKKNPTTDTI